RMCGILTIGGRDRQGRRYALRPQIQHSFQPRRSPSMHRSRSTLCPSALLWVTCLAVYGVLSYARAMPQPNAPAQQLRTHIYLPIVSNVRTIVIAGSLQAAADAAKPGDTLVLPSG